MSQKALSQNIAVETSTVPVTISSGGTENGLIIDTQGFESLTFVIGSGTLTSDIVLTPTVNESDDSGMAGETVVPADRLLETIASATFEFSPAVGGPENNARKKLGVTNIKRFVTLDIVGTGGGSGTLMSVTAVLGDQLHTNITSP